MAHFAELDDQNVVIRVIVVSNNDTTDKNGKENEAVGAEFCNRLFGGKWVQTSYNGSMRARYACPGSTYDSSRDVFIWQKPYNSWVLDESTTEWCPPVEKPNDGLRYVWDEQILGWRDVSEFLK